MFSGVLIFFLQKDGILKRARGDYKGLMLLASIPMLNMCGTYFMYTKFLCFFKNFLTTYKFVVCCVKLEYRFTGKIDFVGEGRLRYEVKG